MRAGLRRLGWKVAPSLMADRAVVYERGVRERAGITALAEEFVASHGDRVLYGPFDGLRYRASGDAAVSKLLGIYEAEIQPWIAEALARPPRRFVDIGSADGYYAVGAARLGIPVTAFELSRLARASCAELAAMNSVELDLRGRATASRLARLDLAGALVLCDCEGAEVDILAGPALRQLREATVIAEVHEGFVPGADRTLRERFEPTHTVEAIPVGERESELPELTIFTPDRRSLAVSEMRAGGDIRWIRLSPR